MEYNYYCDGAASMRKINEEYVREAGGWAFAQVKDKKIIFSMAGHEDNTTNNAMELTAILEVLKHYISHYYSEEIYDTVTIYSDSAYCVNMLKENGWVYTWSKNQWSRGKKHEPIENLELVKEIFNLLKKLREGFREVNIVKVKGHSNDELNNYVDKLAVEAKKDKKIYWGSQPSLFG